MKKHILTITSALLLFLCLLSAQLSAQQKFDPELKKKGLLMPMEYSGSQHQINQQLKMQSNASQPLDTELGDLTIVGGNGRNETISIEFLNDFYFVLGKFNKEIVIGSTSLESSEGEAYFLAKFDANFNLVEMKDIGSGLLNIVGFIPFQNDLLLYGLADSTATVNDFDYNFSGTNIFLNLITQQFETRWRKNYASGYENRNFTFSEIAVATNDTNIFFTSDFYTVEALDDNGDLIITLDYDNPTFNFSGISNLMLVGNDLIMQGSFTDPLTIGDVTIDNFNSFFTAFIASIDLGTTTTNWAYALSNEQENIESYGDQLFTDGANNIISVGQFSGAVSWQNTMLTNQNEKGIIVSRFLTDGTLDSSFVVNSERVDRNLGYISNVSNNQLLLASQFNSNSFYYAGDTINRGQLLSIGLNSGNSNAKITDIDLLEDRVNNLQSVTGSVFASGSKNFDAGLVQLDASLSDQVSPIDFNSPLAGQITVTQVIDYESSRYIIGYINGKSQVEDTVLEGNGDITIIKITDNAVDWVRGIPNSNVLSRRTSTAFIYNDALYMSGNIDSDKSIVFDGLTNEVKGSFIAKADLEGNWEWVNSFGGYLSLNQKPFENEIYVSGWFFDSIRVNNEIVPAIDNSPDATLITLKYDEEGNNLWYRRVTGEGSSFVWSGNGLDVNEFGVVSSINFFNPSELRVKLDNDSSFNSQGSIIVRYDSDGTLNWIESIFEPGISAFDGSMTQLSAVNEDVILSGNVRTKVAIVNDTLFGQSFGDIYIARLSQSEGVKWNRIIKNNSNSYTTESTKTDSKGNIYLNQYSINGHTILPEEEKTPASSYFMTKFDPDGNFKYINTYGFSNRNRGGIGSVNIPAEDNVVLSGSLNGAYSIGGQNGYIEAGQTAIITFCRTPNSNPSAIEGDTLVIQADTTVYINNEDFYQADWELTPSSAGEIIQKGASSASIIWSETFTGNAELRYRETNACGIGMFSQALVIEVAEEGTLSVDNALSRQVMVYPNPGKDVLYITSELKQKSASVHILDVSGREIYESQNFTLNNTLDISSFKPGLYLLKVSFTEGEVVKRFVKE